MSDYRPLDGTADVLPVGLQPTPFGEVWQALQQVAAGVWDVDPSVYRAGMAWLWYAVNHPDKLASDSLRALLVAALISEQAPMVKDWQTNAELVEYLRIWRTYSPTYAKLEAIFATFGARVEVRPISDAESQGIVPVADRRLAFYLRVEDFDAARPLTLDEVYQIAVRATPLGARPVPYFALVGASDVFAGPASAGLVRALWASEPAEPVTPPTPPSYTEITLYLVSGNKQAQSGVTSSFTGNVNSNYCYQLYTDAGCTIPWKEYDYSNDYELGTYVGGVWTPFIRQNVASMPASTTGNYDYVFGRILLDTGELWHVSNYQLTGTTSAINPIVRIYPKSQQHYAFYNESTYLHRNASLSNGNIDGLKGVRGISGAQTVPWGVQDSTLPVRTIVKILGAAGNEISSTGLDWRDPSFGYNFYQLANSSGSSISYRSVIFTLSVPTESGYTNLVGTDASVGTTAVPLYKKTGGKVDYDPAYSYRVIGIFKANGNAANGTWSNVNSLVLADDGSGKMTVKRSSGSSISLNRVWYIKEVINPIETTFGTAVTIPAGFEVESVQCEAIFVKADTVSLDGTTVVNFEFNGERAYCNDTNTSLFGVRVDPCLQLFVLTSDTSYTGYYLSCRSSFTGSNRASTASASVLNGGGKFLVGTATASASDMAYIDAALRIRPVWISRTDSSGNRIPYYYKIQQSVWNFSGGVFSWLGDITDATDPAHWYNGVAVRINLRPITT